MGPGFMNQVRYVDLGLVSKEMYTGIWGYGNLIDINCLTVIKFLLKEPTWLISFTKLPVCTTKNSGLKKLLKNLVKQKMIQVQLKFKLHS